MLLKLIYKLTHWNVKDEDIPYYWNYSLWKVFTKSLRKWMSVVFIPSVPWNTLRIALYRMCGYKIGKNVFIGMKCYLDDMCYDKITIGDDVGISYGVYFACHGRKQSHHTITIRKGTHIGMRSSIVAKEDLVIGENCMVGAMSLVISSLPDHTTAVGVPCKVIKNEGYKPVDEFQVTRTQ